MMNREQHLQTDLALELGDHRIRPVYKVGDQLRRLPAGRGTVRDIRAIGGRDNLSQAIMMRLLTPVGDLSDLGHPSYGSRLQNLIGRPNNDATRNLARLYILESLQQEPRVEKITRVEVSQVSGQPDMIGVELEVKVAAGGEPVTIGPFTFSLT